MPSFEFKAVSPTGKIVIEVLEAANEQIVTKEIVRKGYRPISIKKRKEDKGGAGEISLFKPKVKTDEIVLFTKEMVTLLRAGVPMLTSLEALASQSTKTFGEILNKVYVDVMSGKSLSQALDQHPKVFSKLYVNSIHAGEMSGSLDEVLERMAGVLLHDEETKRKVKSAMRYPILVILAMVAAFVVVMTMVIPKFALIFEGFNMDLPIFTRILLDLSNFFKQYIFIILCIIIVVIIGFQIYIKNPKGRFTWDAFKMKIPLIGNLITKSAMARFTKMFETLNRSGLPIIQTLNTVSNAVGNMAIEKTIKQVAGGVEGGQGIAGAMKKFVLFPPMVVRMISIGEQSGSLDDMLGSISNHFDMEVEYAIKGLTSMIEPMLTVVLGGAVTVMALGIFLPMWNLAGSIQ